MMDKFIDVLAWEDVIVERAKGSGKQKHFKEVFIRAYARDASNPDKKLMKLIASRDLARGILARGTHYRLKASSFGFAIIVDEDGPYQISGGGYLGGHYVAKAIYDRFGATSYSASVFENMVLCQPQEDKHGQ